MLGWLGANPPIYSNTCRARLLPVTNIPVLEVHATTCAAQSLGSASGWPKSLLNPTKRSNLPRDAVIMQKNAEKCAWSDFWSPPPLKRLLFHLANFVKLPIFQYLQELGPGARFQCIANTCWKVRPSSRSILTGIQFNLSTEPYPAASERAREARPAIALYVWSVVLSFRGK